jgi:hypothetical protein
MAVYKSGTVTVDAPNQWVAVGCPSPQFFGGIKYGKGWVGH